MDDINWFDKYFLIQIWDKNDNLGSNLSHIVKKVEEDLKIKNNVKIIAIEGLTFFLPDFFSELYGWTRGYLIWIERNVDPIEIKKTCISLEKDAYRKRFCDIDVYISMSKSIHRKDIK